MIKFISKIFLCIILFFIVFILWYYFFQEELLFRPNTTVLSNKKYTNEYIQTAEVAIPILHSLDESCDSVILFFHGNWWNIYTQDLMYGIFYETKKCFLTVEYPWYGSYDSEISSIDDLYKIWDRWYSYLIDKWYTNQSIIPWWYSLGWWIASYVAHKYSTDQLVLQSTYTSLWSVAKFHFPFLPVKYLFKYNLETDILLEKYDGKVTIFHGKSDAIVSYEEALENFSVLSDENAELVPFDWWHNVFPRKPFIDTINRSFAKY